MNFDEWATSVIETLKAKNNTLFQKAIDSYVENFMNCYAPNFPHTKSPLNSISNNVELLELLRSEEPSEFWEAEETPETYADFLLERWDWLSEKENEYDN